jgi:hypothetical protein
MELEEERNKKRTRRGHKGDKIERDGGRKEKEKKKERKRKR